MAHVNFRKPPSGAPEGTVWFGGPVDRFKVTLRVFGPDLDPDRVSALLGCQPSQSARRGDPYPRNGRWLLTITSEEYGEEFDVCDGIKLLLERLPAGPELWAALTRDYRVDVSCGLFLEADNRGFGLPVEISKMLVERNLEIGFDIYGPETGEVKS